MKRLAAMLCSLLMLSPVLALAESVSAGGEKEIATWFVVVMGMGIVFIGLICLIVLIWIMGKIMKSIGSKAAPQEAPQRAAAPAPVAQEAIPNRGELVAAISAALAEELGTDVKAIRIHSIKRV